MKKLDKNNYSKKKKIIKCNNKMMKIKKIKTKKLMMKS